MLAALAGEHAMLRDDMGVIRHWDGPEVSVIAGRLEAARAGKKGE